ncbi:LON peptidase substrate-binding domain-containing protein [Acetobacter estunensis]|uniref:LON peptidase substrate-binding domain-containing protein n=1 Tax=Acetobacter estunensis TaxID=104097 RepID=UPI001C2CD702|nr:LON peptidase substrate-binding domain-containing protein [Acetobacter estunensis]MBV1836595.1 LON peptidase substrate-binding domain-containing protein [Acetobacter estunensis]
MSLTQAFFEDDVPRLVPRLADVTLADLPAEVGLFPLVGTLLLPRGKLPLNVFEPRYVALVEDALAGERLIGVIQPFGDGEEDEEETGPLPLFEVGTLGRITSFSERMDGTFAITLTGISRFRYLRESGERRGYRRARIDASAYAGDLSELPPAPFDREHMMASLRTYFQLRGMGVRWEVIDRLEDDALLIALPMICPFPSPEKQALLEADTLTDRARVLQSLLDLSDPTLDDGPPS